MSAMEDSLRRALEGGDASDPVFRESIYAASERALERMLQSRQSGEAEAFEQRSRLAATIDQVEADYAATDPAPETGAPPHEPYDEPADERLPHPAPGWADDEPHLTGEDAGRAPRSFVPDEVDETHEENWTPGGERPQEAVAKPRARSPLLVPLAAIIFAALLAFLAYTIGGALRGSGDTSDASGASGASVESVIEQDAQQTAALPEIKWIDVFDGNDLEALSTPNGGRIEVAAKANGRQAVRVAAPTGGEGEVLLSIGPGVVREIAGHSIRVELTAGSPDESLREFSIRCLFGAESACDRQRFSTAMSEEAFVFDVAVPADVPSPGSIAIGPGLSGPNDVDIYSVRIRQLD